MKHHKLLACVLALLTAVPAVLADDDFALFNLGIGGQYWHAKDIDRDNDFDTVGLWGGNIIFRIRPIRYLGFDFRAGAVGNWHGETHRIDGRRYKDDESFTCVPLEVGLVAMLPLGDVVTLYGGPGAGWYYYKFNYSGYSTRHGHHYRKEYDEEIDLDDDFGWYAVLGATFKLCPHFSLFGEARYVDTETKLKDYSDIKIDCSGVGAQIGAMFDF